MFLMWGLLRFKGKEMGLVFHSQGPRFLGTDSVWGAREFSVVLVHKNCTKECILGSTMPPLLDVPGLSSGTAVSCSTPSQCTVPHPKGCHVSLMAQKLYFTSSWGLLRLWMSGPQQQNPWESAKWKASFEAIQGFYFPAQEADWSSAKDNSDGHVLFGGHSIDEEAR